MTNVSSAAVTQIASGESKEKAHFAWTRFYESVADKLLAFMEDRTELVKQIHTIATHVDSLSNLQDRFADGTSGPLKDICPFTTFGIFNRGITETNRKIIAGELAKFLGVQEAVPESFEGLPVLNNQKSWFFRYEKDRGSSDINALWTVFAAALKMSESDDTDIKSAFIQAFDEATSLRGVAWNLTSGLYWIRPWRFASLDSLSRQYILNKLKLTLDHKGQKILSGANYCALLENLKVRFKEEVFAVHSFPGLSLAAWQDKPKPEIPVVEPEKKEEIAEVEVESEAPKALPEPYSIDSIVAEGCFLERAQLQTYLERLLSKKNLILQGPPGTGKTWLAKRLAFALLGQRDDNRVRALQFHPNMSYEDFVRGWRPNGDGKLSLIDGPFLEMVAAALAAPASKHVVVIEEINRGNPAQIFGEMLTLMEADKRTPTEALELCYRQRIGERVFIPDNLYIIGTMNIADRSLALVDLALRRRFAFIDLEPKFGSAWRRWVGGRCHVEGALLDEIEKRMLALNDGIAADASLGRQFRLGHSFVTPPQGVQILDFRSWFKQVVQTEIRPLLEEYWFDATDKAQDVAKSLIEGM